MQQRAEASGKAPPDNELADLIAETVDDPLRYVLSAFDWGYGDLEGQDGPDEWQREVLDLIGKKCLTIAEALRVAIAAGHGVGKSALVSWLILWAMSTRPHLNGVVTANTKNQLDGKTWRELAVWHKRAINAHWFEWTATKFSSKWHPNTWFVQAVPWSKAKPEAFAGLHAEHVLMIFDEASAIEDIIWETAEGALTTPGAIWCCFGNPTRNTGRFRECFGRFRHRWDTRQIDSRGAKMANPAQIKQWIDDYGEDSDFVKVRVRGLFPSASSTQFIPTADVEAAQARYRTEALETSLPRILGVDVARFGDDQSVILVRNGDEVGEVIKYRGVDTVKLAGYVAEIANRVSPLAIMVDGGGVGGGVIDILKSSGFKVTEVQAGAAPQDQKKYANVRAEMWDRMRDWIKRRGRLPDDNELRDDLIGLEYGYNVDMQIQLEKKDDMKKRGLASPDVGDALALTFARILPAAESITAGKVRARTSYETVRPGISRWRR